MKHRPWFVLAASSALLIASACSQEVVDFDEAEAEATSCESAKIGTDGKCRVGSKLAKKSCCAVPRARRTLDAYGCPAGDKLIPVAFFDADSTLRISRSGSPTASEIDDVYVLPFAARTIAKLNKKKMLVAVVSNQGGVAAGHETLETAEGALLFMIKQLYKIGGKVNYLDLAEAKDENRKPETGMATRLDGLLSEKCGRGIDWAKSFMVGDAGYKEGVDGPHPDGRPADDFANSDRGLAENLGIPFHEPTDYFGWRTWETYNIHDKGDLTGLLDAIRAEIDAIAEEAGNVDRYEMLLDEWNDNRSINDLGE